MPTLKKAYHKDAGTEVYQGLQVAPAIAMPVVLAQLKQKNKDGSVHNVSGCTRGAKLMHMAFTSPSTTWGH